MSRDALIDQWLTQNLTNFSLSALGGDASFRRYLRVTTAEQTYMLMDAPPELEPVHDFVYIDELLFNSGVRVPKIVAASQTQGFLLLEDFGSTLFYNKLNPETAFELYKTALGQMVHMQTQVTQTTKLPHYSEQRLETECSLFTQWFLPYLEVEQTQDFELLWSDTVRVLVAGMLAQPQVFVHRDYHCRNLMYLEGEADLGVIDFQDAVVGAASYDLVSLLKDAYVNLDSKLSTELFEYSWQAQLKAGLKVADQFDHYLKDAAFSAVQRALKVLGIFVRLSERDGKHGYINDLPQVYSNLKEQLEHLPELAKFSDWLHTHVEPKFKARFTA